MKKVVVIFSVLAAVFLGAAEFYVQTDGFTELIRPFIIGPLQKLAGPEAHFGDVKANFLPPRIEVRDIIIPDQSGKPVITIRKIRAFLNPLPLVFKKIRLPSITILEPRMYTERAPDGSFTILPLADRIRANTARSDEGTAGSYNLLLKSLSIRKGEIWLTDDTLTSRVSVTDLNISARFNMAKDKVSVNIRATHVSAVAPAYPPFYGELRAAFEYDQGKVLLKAAELSMEDASITLHGETSVSSDPALHFDGRIVSGPRVLARFADFLKPRSLQQGPHAETTVAVRGTASNPEVSGEARISGLACHAWTLQDAVLAFRYQDRNLLLGGGNWRVTERKSTFTVNRIGAALTYQRGILDIRQFELAAEDLVVRMQGTVDPARGFGLHATVISSGDGRAVAFTAGVPMAGRITVEGDLTGAVASPRFEGELNAGPVVVRGIRFSEASGAVLFHDGRLVLSSVDIRSPGSRYLMDGEIDLAPAEPVYSARLRVLQSDVVSIVALFYETLPLELSAHGELSFQGTANAYSGTAYLSLDAGKAYGESFSRAMVTASLTTGKISFPQVVVYKHNGMIKGSGWISFDGKYKADLEGTDVRLSSVDSLKELHPDGNASFEVHSSGTFNAPVVRSAADVDGCSLHNFSLGQMHVTADIEDGRMKINTNLSDDRLRATLLWTLHGPYAWNAAADVDMDDIDPFLAFGNSAARDRVKLVVRGSASLHGRGLDRSAVSGEAVLQQIGITVGDIRLENTPPSRIAVERGVVAVRSLHLKGPGTQIGISGTGTTAAPDFAITGTTSLSLLKPVFPEVEYASGAADLRVTVKESWSTSSIGGSLAVRQGEIKVRDIPQKIGAMTASLSFSQDRINVESLTGELGGGTISVAGWAQLSGLSFGEFTFKSSVDNVTIRYPEGLTSTLSGRLFFDGTADERTLSGDVLIKRARYDKRIEWKSMLVDIGRGLYQKKQADIGWIGETQINVRFHGNDNIQFQNNLAQMLLEIDVFLHGTVNHPHLIGRIESRKGVVYFRKNEFKIQHASADFIDPNRMNPVLDIQAETQVREYLINLAITGTADRASVTLISDPALADTDILSMLALGKKGIELKGKETTVGVGEAASFATGQFQDIFERRARGLTGLDRFQVDPYVSKNDTSVPRVTVGKELVQNKLYVTYSSNVGASIPEQALRIEYLLNKHYSLVGERNEVGNYGADLKYRFEFK
jgi:autotransporter translocation and assembly factor TamB